MFRGREVTHPERGTALLDRLAEELSEIAAVEQTPIQDGRNMTMLLAPSKAVLAGETDNRPRTTSPRSGGKRSRRERARPRRAPKRSAPVRATARGHRAEATDAEATDAEAATTPRPPTPSVNGDRSEPVAAAAQTTPRTAVRRAVLPADARPSASGAVCFTSRPSCRR